jgi:hypothetical protein
MHSTEISEETKLPKTKIFLNDLQRLISYVTETTLRTHYKDKPVDTIVEKSLFTLWIVWKA